MRNPTVYLKMRVLGAIDVAEGSSIQTRIKVVSQMTFTDEDGQRSPGLRHGMSLSLDN